MRFDIISIFPEALASYLNTSILKRARRTRAIEIRLWNPRDFATDTHRTTDDRPYGGGPGMVFKIEPLARAVEAAVKSAKRERTKIILLSAGGKQFAQVHASAWAKRCERLILIAGRYEGVDERIKKVCKLEEISIGPYVLTGGELAAMVIIDALARHIPGVLGKQESLEEVRQGVGVPTYTRPEAFRWRGKTYRVPAVLLSGDHGKISRWRARHRRESASGQIWPAKLSLAGPAGRGMPRG